MAIVALLSKEKEQVQDYKKMNWLNQRWHHCFCRFPHELLYAEAGGAILFGQSGWAGGAVEIRANSVRDIKEIKEVTKAIIIGIIKRDYLPEEPFITATMKEVDELGSLISRLLRLIVHKRSRHEAD